MQQVPAALRKPAEEAPPSQYVCPITQDIMEDPVVASDGHTCMIAPCPAEDVLSQQICSGQPLQALTAVPLHSASSLPGVHAVTREARPRGDRHDPRSLCERAISSCSAHTCIKFLQLQQKGSAGHAFGQHRHVKVSVSTVANVCQAAVVAQMRGRLLRSGWPSSAAAP